jgi:hypothetical protein
VAKAGSYFLIGESFETLKPEILNGKRSQNASINGGFTDVFAR